MYQKAKERHDASLWLTGCCSLVNALPVQLHPHTPSRRSLGQEKAVSFKEIQVILVCRYNKQLDGRRTSNHR